MQKCKVNTGKLHKKSLQNHNPLANDFTFNFFYANSAFRKKIFKNQIAKFGGLLEKIIKIHFGHGKKNFNSPHVVFE